jgi:hypothetical protein
MSASCVTRKIERRIERRTRLQSWGIEIETWQLLDTRTLPSECARLPLSTIFADPDQGATPAALTDDDDTLEAPIGEITRENEVAPDYDVDLEVTSERPVVSLGQEEGGAGEAAAAVPQHRATDEGGNRHGR